EPEWYFAELSNKGFPQARQRYMPSASVSTYSPVKARSVPAWRSTWYSCGVSLARHSSSVVGTSFSLGSFVSTIRSSCFHSEPNRAAHTGAAHAAIAPGNLVQVLLMILLGIVERTGPLQLGLDLTVTGLT